MRPAKRHIARPKPVRRGKDAKPKKASPHRVEDAKHEAVVLAKKLGMKPAEVEKKLQQDRMFVWLKRRIDPKLGVDIKALGLASVGSVPESRRYYPNRTLFSHVLGAVDVD